MEFIQKKTADQAVEHFLFKAVDQEISLPWDRFEGQLPECGFCESGLSCRDCLQGPCISHPFRSQSKVGVCGKDKDILAVQSLLRLVLKGTMGNLDQVNDFIEAVSTGQVEPQNKALAEEIIKDIIALLHNGNAEALKSLPQAVTDKWAAAGVTPQGIAQDVIKATQKVEGGITGVEETLLWTIKAALMGCIAKALTGKLKGAVFGDAVPTPVTVNMGVLEKDGINILIYGPVSPVLKAKVAAKAGEKNIKVMGVCTDPLLPPYIFSAVTNYGSQEIPFMTGAVDLVVAADQYVNPSLEGIAKDWKVKIVPVNGLKKTDDLDAFADEIIKQAEEAHNIRRDVPRDIPADKETAMLGYSAETVDAKKIADAVNSGKIKGIVIFSGSNNVKYAQDTEFKVIVEEFLAKDILCISDGEASIALAKYGFLNPEKEIACSDGLKSVLATLGDKMPAVIDWSAADFLQALAGAEGKALSQYPIGAYFAEANRSAEVAKAVTMVAMGVSVYFWPILPITGSTKATDAMETFCSETFGGKLNVVTAKIDARAKAALFLEEVDASPTMSGKDWK
jgi:anaerobic carbon-monoxide dehydrogenase catalytic subunit